MIEGLPVSYSQVAAGRDAFPTAWSGSAGGISLA
ncbi:hypothetical protein ES703_80575 [subsurface metagenome]